MNLTLSFWSSLAGLLAVEAALVAAAAWLASRWLSSPQMQRAVWQAALLGIALLWVAELAGARGQLAKLRPPAPPARTLSVRLLDAPRGEPVAEPFPDSLAEAALPVVTPPRPVWWPGWLWLAGLTLLTGRLVLARAGLAWCAFKTRDGLKSPPSREHGLSSPLHCLTATTPDDTDAIIEVLRHQLGLRRVRVLVWPRLRGPVAFGVLRPTVALPEDFTARFSPAQRAAMLAHELAHLAARDPLWLALADLVCALAWWHPAVWWARRQLRAACESAADEAAALVPDGRAALAESLVTFGRELASPRWARGIGVAGDGLKSQLARRVKVLLHASGEWRAVRPARLWATRLGAAGVIAALVVAPWPGVNGAGLTPLLAAVKAAEPTVLNDSAGGTSQTRGESAAPIANSGESQQPANPSSIVTVEGTARGGFRFKGQPVEGKLELEQLLIAAHQANKELVVRIRVDRAGPVQTLVTILDICRRNGITRFDLATEPANLPLPPSDDATVQMMIQAGVRLMESRQFDAAEAKFRAALALSPSNAVASHYLNLNRENRVTPASSPSPAPAGPGHDRILAKLAGIVLPEVSFQSVTLAEAVRQLEALASRYDPDQRGVNLLINSAVPAAQPAIDPATGKAPAEPLDLGGTVIRLDGVLRNVRLLDAVAALVKAAETPLVWSVEDHAVVISAVGPKQAAPLFTRRFKVDSATFLAGLAAVTGLDPVSPTATNRTALAQQEVRRFFKAAGVDIPETIGQAAGEGQDRRALFFNDRTGDLFVRATATDLDVIDRAVQALTPPPPAEVVDPAKPATPANEERAELETKLRESEANITELRTRYKDGHPKVVEALALQAGLQAKLQALKPDASAAPARAATTSEPPPQIELEVQFAELTERGGDDLGLDWLFGQSPTNNPALQSGPATNLLTEPGAPRGQNLRVDLLRTEGQSATLTAAQFAALRKRLEGRSGFELLTTPKVITESGRQARISVGDVRTIVAGVAATPGGATNQAAIHYQTEQIETGPSVDLIPTLEGATTRLAIVATVTEFLGYDEPKRGQAVQAAQPGGPPVKGVMPLPRLRVRSIQADASALAGETVVLRGPLVNDTLRTKDKVPVLGDIPVLGRLFRSESKSTVRKRLYVFVTPARISATGEKQ